MLQNVEYASRPAPFEIEQHDDRAVVVLYDNVREGTNAEGEDCYYADLYYYETGNTPNLRARVRENLDKFLAAAKAQEAEEAAKAEESFTMADLAEIAADHEYRICIVEMGVEL